MTVEFCPSPPPPLMPESPAFSSSISSQHRIPPDIGSPRKRPCSTSVLVHIAVDSSLSITQVVNTPCAVDIEPLPLPSPVAVVPVPPKERRRKAKQNTADSCIRRLCASHQDDIGLLCDLWSSPTPQLSEQHSLHVSSTPTATEPVVLHTAAESERQRLLQLEMQLMRMQLQQAELLLPPSRSSPSPLSRTPTPPEEPPMSPSNSDEADETCRKPQLLLPLDDDPAQSTQIAQEVHQNLLWAEADYRAQKRGRPSGSKPSTPTSDPLDHSDLRSVSPSSAEPTTEFVNAPLYQGYLKMPRGLFCKFWCAKKRFCMLDSAGCFFYWKSKERRNTGRAKCFSGVTGGILLPGDDKAIELTYAGGSCVTLLRCDTAAEANRWLVALASLDSDSWNGPRMLDAESLADPGVSISLQSGSRVSTSKSSPNPELLRRTLTDCNIRREVIQNAFLDEFRKEQQFEQLLRASKGNSTSSCARESRVSPLVSKEQRVH